MDGYRPRSGHLDMPWADRSRSGQSWMARPRSGHLDMPWVDRSIDLVRPILPCDHKELCKQLQRGRNRLVIPRWPNAGSAEGGASGLGAEPVPGGVATTAAEFVLLAALGVGVEVPEGALLATPRPLDRLAADCRVCTGKISLEFTQWSPRNKHKSNIQSIEEESNRREGKGRRYYLGVWNWFNSTPHYN